MHNELLKKLERMRAENFLFFVDMLKHEINAFIAFLLSALAIVLTEIILRLFA